MQKFYLCVSKSEVKGAGNDGEQVEKKKSGKQTSSRVGVEHGATLTTMTGVDSFQKNISFFLPASPSFAH